MTLCLVLTKIIAHCKQECSKVLHIYNSMLSKISAQKIWEGLEALLCEHKNL